MKTAEIARLLQRPYMSVWKLKKAGKITIVDGQPIITYARAGRKSKRRESYATIAAQLGVSEQTAINYDRQGKILDTGEGWIIVKEPRT